MSFAQANAADILFRTYKALTVTTVTLMNCSEKYSNFIPYMLTNHSDWWHKSLFIQMPQTLVTLNIAVLHHEWFSFRVMCLAVKLLDSRIT